MKIGKQINEKNKRKLINKQNKTTFPSNKNNKIRCINQKIIKDNWRSIKEIEIELEIEIEINIYEMLENTLHLLYIILTKI